MPPRQAIRQRLRQTRRPDLVLRRRDVVLNPSMLQRANAPAAAVIEQIRRAPVAVPGLAHAAGIDDHPLIAPQR